MLNTLEEVYCKKIVLSFIFKVYILFQYAKLACILYVSLWDKTRDKIHYAYTGVHSLKIDGSEVNTNLYFKLLSPVRIYYSAYFSERRKMHSRDHRKTKCHLHRMIHKA